MKSTSNCRHKDICSGLTYFTWQVEKKGKTEIEEKIVKVIEINQLFINVEALLFNMTQCEIMNLGVKSEYPYSNIN